MNNCFFQMLKHLSIQNYALIEKIEMDFAEGLTIITGETGAGKSILLGALGLIAGNRADSSMLQDKTKKCIVEGIFENKNFEEKNFLLSNQLDYSEQTILRREISSEGKSRSFINDTPVSLSQLSQLCLQLIDIHSQHETLFLNEAAYQLSVVDAFAPSTRGLVSRYKLEYKQYKEDENRLTELMGKEKQSKMDADYWQFQFNELHDANLSADEQEKIESELKMLTHAEEIKSTLSRISCLLSGEETNATDSLIETKNLLSKISSLTPSFAELLNRLSSVCIELKDIAAEINSSEEKINYDPAHTEKLSERIDLLYRLEKKHRVNSVQELIEIKDKLENQLSTIASLEEEIRSVQQKMETERKSLFELAKKISLARKNSLHRLESEIKTLLSNLAMPNARFLAEHTLLETFTENGLDKMRFLFSANKGTELKEVSKAASGGELSRLMLCVKYLIAKKTFLPAIIFDEIDSGVSGGTAERMGKMIANMAESMQIVVITHLPQIASKGNFHFTVYKKEEQNKTLTKIKLLGREERVQEIATLLSAGKPTDASRKNAKELLGMGA